VPGTYTLSVWRTPNQIDSDMTCSRSFDRAQITKRIERQSGLTKTHCFEKTTHLFSFKRNFFAFFKKDTGFCSLKKTQNPLSEFFYCIMQYHHIQNYTIITCYTHYGIQI